MSQPESRKSAIVALIGLSVFLLVGLAAYVRWTGGTARPGTSPHVDESGSSSDSLGRIRQIPHMVFRHTGLGGMYGRAVLASLDALNASRVPTSLECDRVHMARGRGVCLVAARGVVTTYKAVTFDETFSGTHEIALPGVPSRVQMSPDGTRAGLTVFVSGDSYASGTFSTRTFIIDAASGDVLGNLEEYAVTRNGRPFKAVDFNFWGVTFADANRFYATLATGGETYLIEGDVNERRARTVHEGVECPSLSPDGTRVAFKKRIRDGVRLSWRLGVLDLASLKETLIADARNVDDQAEWLDDEQVIYGLPSATVPGSSDIWASRADGTGEPRMLAADGWSPAVVGGGNGSPLSAIRDPQSAIRGPG
jgi:hypothetical protein